MDTVSDPWAVMVQAGAGSVGRRDPDLLMFLRGQCANAVCLRVLGPARRRARARSMGDLAESKGGEDGDEGPDVVLPVIVGIVIPWLSAMMNERVQYRAFSRRS